MISTIAHILVLVGGLNWGLVGIGTMLNMDLNVVHMLFGMVPYLESIVYILVGASAVKMIVSR